MIVPLYNAELAPPEIRGSLVALQQLAVRSYLSTVVGRRPVLTNILFTDYLWHYDLILDHLRYVFRCIYFEDQFVLTKPNLEGTNFIGGQGDTQERAAWLVPITIQLAPAIILGIGILFMPQSPRWLINQGRDEETRSVIANLRRLPPESNLVEIEYLEVKAQRLFEERISQRDYPELQDRSLSSRIKLGLRSYASLLTNSSNFKRTAVAVLIMTFQQWTGVNFILYYAPFIFHRLGLDASTTSLFASGIVGIVMFLATIPAVLYIDKWGRKPTLIAGAVVMGLCQFIVAGIIGQSQNDWPAHRAAGWAAVAFIWIFSIAFGISWGPCAWIVVAEVFPLGLRAKGVSIGASANWLNNFAVGMSTPSFVTAAPYGVYIFLGMMCVLGALYVAFLVPETKGRTLDEMDGLFGDKSGRNKTDADLLYNCMHEVGLLRAVGVENGVSNSSEEKMDDTIRKEKMGDSIHHEYSPKPATQTQNV